MDNNVIVSTAPGLGILVAIITRYIVCSPKFPWVKPEQRPRVQAIAAFLSAVAAVMTAWQSHSIGESEVLTLLTTAQLMIETLGISALFHHWFLKPSNPNKGLDKTIDSKIEDKMDEKIEQKIEEKIEEKKDELN